MTSNKSHRIYGAVRLTVILDSCYSGSGARTRTLTPMTWSIERLSFESVKAP